MNAFHDEHEEMLAALREGLEESAKRDPGEEFDRLVAIGLIDRKGRLRPEIIGLADPKPRGGKRKKKPNSPR